MPDSSLRDRTRAAMRAEVAAIAVREFAEHGFDAVTAADIAASAGISARSFFRYFDTKEDVVLAHFDEAGDRVRRALVARPDDEPVRDALRAALHVVTQNPVFPANQLPAIAAIALNTPSIQARQLGKLQRWEQLLAPEIIRRFGMTTPEPHGTLEVQLRARALIGAALVCLRLVTEAWLHDVRAFDPGKTLDELLRATL